MAIVMVFWMVILVFECVSASQEKLSEHSKQRALQGNPQPPGWNENWDLPRPPSPISELLPFPQPDVGPPKPPSPVKDDWDLPRPPSAFPDEPQPPSWLDIPRPPGSSNHPGHINQDRPRIPGTGPGNGIHPPSDPRGPIIYP